MRLKYDIMQEALCAARDFVDAVIAGEGPQRERANERYQELRWELYQLGEYLPESPRDYAGDC